MLASGILAAVIFFNASLNVPQNCSGGRGGEGGRERERESFIRKNKEKGLRFRV